MWGQLPRVERPLPNPPQREGVSHNHLKHSRNELPPPWGGPGRGPSKAAVFVPAPAGLFLPPTAVFFTVDIAGVMRGMTVGMAPMLWRKTCFPTGIGGITTKAKPPAVPTAFCVYFIPMWVEQIKANSGMPTSSGREAPPQPSPKGGSFTQPPQTQQEWTPAPWGGLGRGFYPQSQPSPRGRSQSQTAQNTARMDSRPLGRVGEGLLSTTPTTTTNISRIFSSSTKITTIFTAKPCVLTFIMRFNDLRENDVRLEQFYLLQNVRFEHKLVRFEQ